MNFVCYDVDYLMSLFMCQGVLDFCCGEGVCVGGGYCMGLSCGVSVCYEVDGSVS